MPEAGGLEKRFLERLAENLDVKKTISELKITEEEARSILKGLLRPGRAQMDFFGKASKGAQHEARPAHPAKAHKGYYLINVDGASRGNPGEAGAGAVIRDPEGNVVKKLKKYLGITTNNMAEYHALVMALEIASALGLQYVEVLADSELMVKQLNGLYRVKSEDLRPLYEKAQAILKGFKGCKVRHVYREENSAADALANEAIDGHRHKN